MGQWILNNLDWAVFAFFLAIALIIAMVYRSRLLNYLRDVRQEWARVSVPTREEAVSHTYVVLAGVAITAAFLFVVDWILGTVMQFFYRL